MCFSFGIYLADHKGWAGGDNFISLLFNALSIFQFCFVFFCHQAAFTNKNIIYQLTILEISSVQYISRKKEETLNEFFDFQKKMIDKWKGTREKMKKIYLEKNTKELFLGWPDFEDGYRYMTLKAIKVRQIIGKTKKNWAYYKVTNQKVIIIWKDVKIVIIAGVWKSQIQSDTEI